MGFYSPATPPAPQALKDGDNTKNKNRGTWKNERICPFYQKPSSAKRRWADREGGDAEGPRRDPRTISLAHLTGAAAPSFGSPGSNKVTPAMQIRHYFIFIKCHTLR